MGKQAVKVFLHPRDIYILKLDAMLANSTVSARVRNVLEEHCRTLEKAQPKPFEALAHVKRHAP